MFFLCVTESFSVGTFFQFVFLVTIRENVSFVSRWYFRSLAPPFSHRLLTLNCIYSTYFLLFGKFIHKFRLAVSPHFFHKCLCFYPHTQCVFFYQNHFLSSWHIIAFIVRFSFCPYISWARFSLPLLLVELDYYEYYCCECWKTEHTAAVERQSEGVVKWIPHWRAEWQTNWR